MQLCFLCRFETWPVTLRGKQDRQCNVKFWGVRVTIVAVETQQWILCFCVVELHLTVSCVEILGKGKAVP
jgi:hypothetical protein